MISGRFAFLSVSAISFSILGGCAAATDDGGTDPVEVEASEQAITGAPSNFGYFVVTRRDPRKCASPMCGGWFVKRVNEAKTRCANGTLEEECYVSSIQLSGVGLSAREEEDVRASVESGKAVIKARTYKTSFGGMRIGYLKASEAWVGATGSQAAGTFYRAADNGVRCVTAPCPSTTAHELNGHERHDVIDVVLDQMEASVDHGLLNRARNALGTNDGIIVAGDLLLPKCVPGSDCGPKVVASEFFVRVVRREGEACGFWQTYDCNEGQFCSWAREDMCGAADAPGRCAYKPDLCTRIYMPVCGCDGKNYGNPCMAAASGTSVSSAGVCATAP